MKSKIKKLLQSRQELALKKKEWEAVGSYKAGNPFAKVFHGMVIVFFVAFWAAFFTLSILKPADTSSATDVETEVTSGNYYVNITSSDVSMDVVAVTGSPFNSMTVVSSTVTSSSNVPSGYKLFLGISPYDASGNEKTAANKAKNGLYLDGNLSRTDGQVIAAASGTAAADSLAALSDNTWGYAVDKNSLGAPSFWQTENHSTMSSAAATSDKFAAVPTVGNDDLIQSVDTATAQGEENTATLYYGINSNGEKTSGAYSNTIAYTAVAEPDPTAGITFTPSTYTRTVTYDNMTDTDATVTIHTPIFTNMTDLGSVSVTLSGGPASATNLSCSSPTISTDANNMLLITCYLPKAYAGTYDVVVNLPKFGQTYTSTYTYAVDNYTHLSAMQEMTTSFCSAMPDYDENDDPTQFTLVDARDSKSYTIRKLQDSHCWMAQKNLEFVPVDGTTITSANTNLQSGSSITFTTTDSTSSYYLTDDCSSANVDKFCIFYDGVNYPQYGGYYNWYAATASSGTSEMVNTNALYSICPKGWRLPTGGSDASTSAFQTLYNTYNARVDATHTIYQLLTDSTGPNLVLSGNRSSTSMSNQGTVGRYWSSTAYSSATSACNLLLNNSGAVGPARIDSKYNGFSLRCLAE